MELMDSMHQEVENGVTLIYDANVKVIVKLQAPASSPSLKALSANRYLLKKSVSRSEAFLKC